MLAKYINRSTRIAKNLLTERMNTNCPWLWDSVFIDYNGDVYTCCKYNPGVIGNINKQNLKDIWTKSIKLRLFRFMAANKSLHCFYSCNVFPNKIKANCDRTPVVASYPKRVWLLHGQFCNLECIMCDQSHKSKQGLDNHTLKANIDWKRVDDIELQGGEVLAMGNAKELYLWLTQEMGKKVNLITNGVLISDEWAEHLVKGANWIQISVNAATKKTHELVNQNSNFGRVIENIKKMIRLKSQYGVDVEIIYKYTILSENMDEIGRAVEFADALGCDTIAFGYDVSLPALLEDD